LIIVYLAIGGALGTLARYGAGWLAGGWEGDGFPWATFVINVVGSFMLGAVIAFADRSIISPELRTVLGVGFCGAFTTFSTFSVEALALMQAGQTGRAAIYVIGSVVTGLLAAMAGMRVAG
jgi:fluoride exporter